MSLRNTVRALPTVMRIGFSEAVAYRAEMLVWVLATTMPLVMMALWTAVARDAPIGRFGEKEFVAYFLATFIVRQLTGSWAAWQMNFEVRQGTLSMRLLRPFSPIISWAVEHLAAIPLRLVVAIPIALVMLATVGGEHLPSTFLGWLMFLAAVTGGWAITFLVGICIGCLSFFMEQSLKIMDVWLALYFVFSGYLLPVELFPAWARTIVEWLPFRFQIGLPVELLTGRYGLEDAAQMLLRQWGIVALFGLVAWGLWRAGLKRFGAFGG